LLYGIRQLICLQDCIIQRWIHMHIVYHFARCSTTESLSL
jgi:hypothetical protein